MSVQVWQMPIRQPNGMPMPASSPASSTVVAPSDLDGLAGVAERDGAALAAVAAQLEREPLEVQLVLEAGRLEVLR